MKFIRTFAPAGPLASLALSTALVAALAALVILGTTPAQAAPVQAHVTVHAPPSALQLRQMAAIVQGRYALADGRELHVWREAGRLHAELDGLPRAALQSDGPGRLRSADGRVQLQFEAGPDGRAWAVSLVQRR